MADNTKIEWADASWSPITGCSPISAGCDNCYARRMARRLGGRFGYPETPNHFDVTFHPDRLDQPFKWRKPRRIFVCSMGDLFHEDVEDNWINNVFNIMVDPMFGANHHNYILLTKRPERILKGNYTDFSHWPNLWLGVTVEHPDYLWRIEELLKIPAAVRFVSVEPMLEPVDGLHEFFKRAPPGKRRWDIFKERDKGLDWVICGPETGPGARECKPEWIEDLYEQCKAAGVPFFDKRKNYLVREFPKGK